MEDKLQMIIQRLRDNNETISTMESCTGGQLVSLITNVKNASKVLKYSAVTYSDEFKIKMGVNANTISKFTVYSDEVAREMAFAISKFTNSSYGVGITGELTVKDDHKSYVYYAIYVKRINKYFCDRLEMMEDNRVLNKKIVTDAIINKLSVIIL